MSDIDTKIIHDAQVLALTDTDFLNEMEESKSYPFWNFSNWVYIIADKDRPSKIAFRAVAPTVREVLAQAIRWRRNGS